MISGCISLNAEVTPAERWLFSLLKLLITWVNISIRVMEWEGYQHIINQMGLWTLNYTLHTQQQYILLQTPALIRMKRPAGISMHTTAILHGESNHMLSCDLICDKKKEI